jgi:hypothetical protein
MSEEVHPVAVTLGTRRRRPLLTGELAAAVFDLCRFHPRTAAVCVLPERLDWLLSTDELVAREVAQLCATTTRRAQALGHREPLWAPRCRLRRLTTIADWLAAARGTITAPVERGLVRRIEDWPYQLWRM